MRFFDSCAEHVTLADVSEDIASDLAFEKYLKRLHEERERAKAYAARKYKEKNDHEKVGLCEASHKQGYV